MPGKSLTQFYTSRMPRYGPPRTELRAAIFKDGSSFGDPAWVQVIVYTRREFYYNLGLAIDLLKKGQQSGATSDDLFHQLEDLQANLPSEETTDGKGKSHGPEEVDERYPKQRAAEAIDYAQALFWPHHLAPSAPQIPLDKALPQTLARLNAFRQQILESKPSILPCPADSQPRESAPTHESDLCQRLAKIVARLGTAPL